MRENRKLYLLIEAWVILAILSDFMLEEDPTALESSTSSLAMGNIFYLIYCQILR